MRRVIGTILFLVLAYTVLLLTVGHLSPSCAAGAEFLVPLSGLAAAW